MALTLSLVTAQTYFFLLLLASSTFGKIGFGCCTLIRHTHTQIHAECVRACACVCVCTHSYKSWCMHACISLFLRPMQCRAGKKGEETTRTAKKEWWKKQTKNFTVPSTASSSPTHTQTHALSLSHTHTHSLSHTYKHAHTHTKLCFLPDLFLSRCCLAVTCVGRLKRWMDCSVKENETKNGEREREGGGGRKRGREREREKIDKKVGSVWATELSS